MFKRIETCGRNAFRRLLAPAAIRSLRKQAASVKTVEEAVTEFVADWNQADKASA
jgi:hypothetical protein